jgi:hypothetical protein
MTTRGYAITLFALGLALTGFGGVGPFSHAVRGLFLFPGVLALVAAFVLSLRPVRA